MRRVILNFHGLGQPKRQLEPGEAPYWVSPDVLDAALDLAERLSDRVETRFTFDDGNLSDIELGATALERRGRRGAFFVLAHRIGQEGSLDRSHLQDLVARGHEVGSHGAAHVDWRAASHADLGRELVDAKRAIADASGAEVTSAAIPFGRWNGRVLRALRRAGYAQCFSSDGGGWRSGDWPIARTSVRDGMGASDLEDILLGREGRLRSLRRIMVMGLKRL